MKCILIRKNLKSEIRDVEFTDYPLSYVTYGGHEYRLISINHKWRPVYKEI